MVIKLPSSARPLFFLFFVSFLLLIFSYGSVSAIDCPKPSAQIAEETKTDIKGSLDIGGLLRSLKVASGEVDIQLERKVQDLFSKYPNADKLAMQNTIISMICQQLNESKELSDREKLEYMFNLNNSVAGVFERKAESLSKFGDRVESQNPHTRQAALADALASSDSDLRHNALREIFASRKTFAINSVWTYSASRKERKMSAILNVQTFDKASGDLVGILSGSDIRAYNQRSDKKPFKGNLSGINFTGSNENCTVSLSLKNDVEMEGTLKCSSHGGPATMRIR